MIMQRCLMHVFSGLGRPRRSPHAPRHAVCAALVMLPLCHGLVQQQKGRDVVRTCASPEEFTPSRDSDQACALHKSKQLWWAWRPTGPRAAGQQSFSHVTRQLYTTRCHLYNLHRKVLTNRTGSGEERVYNNQIPLE